MLTRWGETLDKQQVLQEYPRPQLVRESFYNLNGLWDYAIKPVGAMEPKTMDGKILVPFAVESSLSGVQKGLTEKDELWYRRTFSVPAAWKGSNVLLNFGAVDWKADVFVNDILVGSHTGGFTPFSLDITPYLKAKGDQKLVVRVFDGTDKGYQPRGKQVLNPNGIWYTPVSGIWQTVWLENMPDAYIRRIKCRPSVENRSVFVEAVCENADGRTLRAAAKFGGKVVGTAETRVSGKSATLEVKLDELHLWNVGDGKLYDLDFELEGGDFVHSYFGMRKVEWKNNRTYINGKVVYQRLILDQGFYPDGIYTAPTEGELIADIKRSMDMGFNGARLHQKVFEPLFLYHCDRLGYIVWGEHANWGLNIARPEAWRGFLPEWREVLERDYNHPAIIGWCPLNETQKDQDRDLIRELADMTRSFDPDRIYIDASGWTHQDAVSDIFDVHDYDQNPETFRARYLPLEQGETITVFNLGKHVGKPPFVSEFGGIWWNPAHPEGGWGYGNRPQSEEEFIARYRGLVTALLENRAISAFCYTQLTDVEQEVNGLYTYDRHPKFPPEVIRAINTQVAAVEKEQ